MTDFSNKPDFTPPSRAAFEEARRKLREDMDRPVRLEPVPRVILGPRTRVCPVCNNPAAPDDAACQMCGAWDGARTSLPEGPCRHCGVPFVMGSCPMLDCPDWPLDRDKMKELAEKMRKGR